jgi:hypothetical protein
MKIAIVGCGALGSYYGACLARSGHDVHFLLRTDLDTVRTQGVQILRPTGDFRGPPKTASSPSEIGACDLVVIGLKTTANAAFPELIPPLTDARTAVLTLQNGLGNEESLAQLLPADNILGGLCFVLVSGLLHVALGILCSCLTRSSALAALLTFICLLGLTAVGGAMESLPIESWTWLGWLREPAAHLRTFGHLQDFAGGILDSRPLVLYITGMMLSLGLAVLAVEGQE